MLWKTQSLLVRHGAESFAYACYVQDATGRYRTAADLSGNTMQVVGSSVSGQSPWHFVAVSRGAVDKEDPAICFFVQPLVGYAKIRK